MGGKIVLTYKRKRSLSRSENSGLHSNATPAFLKSKVSSNFSDREKSRADLPNSDEEFEVAHDSLKIKAGEHVPICENRNLDDPVECSKVSENERGDSSCAKIQDSPVSESTKVSGTLVLENVSSDVTKSVYYQDANFNESLVEKSQICSSGLSVDDKSVKALSVSPSTSVLGDYSNATCMRNSDEVNCCHDEENLSILEMADLEDHSKCYKDDSSCLCCSMVTKPRFSSSLITFHRRSKRKLDATASASAKDKLAHFDCSSLHAPESAIATVMQQDNALHHQDAPSLEPPFHQEASKFQRTSLEDLNTSRIASDYDTEIQYASSFHQSPVVSCRDIDCNRPLDSEFDEKDLPNYFEVPHYTSGSIENKLNGNESMMLMHCPETDSSLTNIRDKGKRPIDSSSSFSKCKSLELFPENISAEKPQLTKERWLCPSQLPFLNSFPLFCGSFDGFTPSTSSWDRYPLLPENMSFTNGNKSSSFDKFSSQNMWLDEELDSLWIGIRRHGRNNLDSILRDPRLHFLPWRTSRDLAIRWQEEQLKLLYSTYTTPQEVSKANLNNLLLDHLSKTRHLQNPVTNLSSSWTLPKYNESSVVESVANKSLPHWLRDAANTKESTPRKSEPDECIFNIQDDTTIVRSDASSEETISDDHNIRA